MVDHNDDDLVKIVQTTYLLSGVVLKSDPIEIAFGDYKLFQGDLRDTRWASTGFLINGDYHVVLRERVDFVKLHIMTEEEFDGVG